MSFSPAALDWYISHWCRGPVCPAASHKALWNWNCITKLTKYLKYTQKSKICQVICRDCIFFFRKRAFNMLLSILIHQMCNIMDFHLNKMIKKRCNTWEINILKSCRISWSNPRSLQTLIVKTGSDSSTAKRSATGVFFLF